MIAEDLQIPSSNRPPYLQWIVKNFQKHPIKVPSECPYYEGGAIHAEKKTAEGQAGSPSHPGIPRADQRT